MIGVLIILFGLFVSCMCGSLLLTRWCEISAKMDKNEEATPEYIKKLFLDAGLFLFGILAGIVLFFTGIVMCF